MPRPSLWVALLGTRCFVDSCNKWGWVSKRGGLTEQWRSSTGFLCIQIAPCSCVSTEQEKHLTWHLEMLKDFLPRPDGGRKGPMMLLQTRVLNARRGGSEFWPHRSGENSQTSVLAAVRGLTLSLVWKGLISFWSATILWAYRTIFLDCTLGLLLCLRRKPQNAF